MITTLYIFSIYIFIIVHAFVCHLILTTRDVEFYKDRS